MTHRLTSVFVWLLMLSALPACGAETRSVSSPDDRVRVTLGFDPGGDQEGFTYAVEFDGRSVLQPSRIVLTSGGRTIGGRLSSVTFGEATTHKSEWRPVYGERSRVVDHYREITVVGRDASGSCSLRHTFRCYDGGVAFKTEVESDSPLPAARELSEFRFGHDAHAWRTTNAQGEYDKVRLSDLGGGVERPLVVQLDGAAYAAITEARVVDYPRMLLQTSADDPHRVVSQLSSDVKGGSRLETPWRVLMLADSPGGLLEGNDLLLNLNDPCQIADTSWIRPGKVLREITLTTAGGLACIDFAVENGFQHIEFDAGWYGNEYDEASDATTVTVDPKRSPGPLDLQRVIDYGAERNIGVILYVNRRALERQLDEILPLFQSWGVAGVKYGFVQVGSQRWNSWLHEAIRKAAKHRLMVDVHDEYRPTGYSRTYPNLMTQEGVRGDEATPASEQTLTTLFTRSLAGATDYTVCYFDKRVAKNWSHTHQLAKAVCFYSPWHFLYWYDTPLKTTHTVGSHKDAIQETPEMDFFRHLPTVWDDTRVIHGAIGEYAVIARRKGDEWFLGALGNGQPRSLDTPLDFLEEGVGYEATLYSDDASFTTPTQVRVEKRRVDAATVLPINLRANGGFAMRIVPSSRPE